MIKQNRKNQKLAWSQIFLLVLGTFAISYALGSSIGVVSGANGYCEGAPRPGKSGYQCYLFDDKVVYTVNSPKQINSDLEFSELTFGSRSETPNTARIVYDRDYAGDSDNPVNIKKFGNVQIDSQGGNQATATFSQPNPAAPAAAANPTDNDNADLAAGQTSSGDVEDFNIDELASTGKSRVVNGEEYFEAEDGTWYPLGGSRGYSKAELDQFVLDANNAAAAAAAAKVSALQGKHVDIKIGEEVKSGVLQCTNCVDANGNSLNTANGAKSYRLVGSDGKVVAEGITAEQAIAGEIDTSFNWGGFFNGVGNTLKVAVGLYAGAKIIGGLIFKDDSAASDALANSLVAGMLAGGLTTDTLNSFNFDQGGWGGTQAIGTYVGAYVGVLYFLNEYRKEESRIVEFKCVPWQAPTGGKGCEECNNKDLPCSDYQCKSLGQSCDIVNRGTDEERCVWINRNDVNPPVITPEDSFLIDDTYSYSPDNTISPPNRGVTIDHDDPADISDDNCIPAFTPLSYGFVVGDPNSNDPSNLGPAKCKVDQFNKPGFEEMDVFLSDGLLRYNHTFILTLPGATNARAEGIELENDGTFQNYIRCEDANGNSNVANFVFTFCVEKGPDTTAPLIQSTSIPNEAPISFNQSSVDMEVYINEPAECKWSHDDRDYDNMENTMDCSRANSIFDANAIGLYTCETTLDGLKNKIGNDFYFKCKDQPLGVPDNERNTNVESYKYTLQGTQPLVIDSVTPEDGDTISDSTNAVKVTFEVKTSAGYNEGLSTCSYSNTGASDDYIDFFKSASHTHTQDLYLTEGTYTYYIRCTDLGGNSDNETITFNVESDNGPPLVVRASHEETYLKLKTEEEASCVYDTLSCSYNFDDGISITTTDNFDHFVDWDISSNLYVKCRDIFGNEPAPDKCSIVAKTTDF